MKLKDFLNQTAKKILIVDTVSIGNALRRKCNVDDGINTYDVLTLTPLNIAKELVFAYKAMNDEGTVRLIDSESAAYILDGVLKEYRPDFIPEKSLTIATVIQINSSLSTIRTFEKTEEYEKASDSKMQDIKKLIDTYENKLSEDGLYDSARIIQEAVAILEKAQAGELEIPLSFYLPWLEEGVFGDLESNKRAGLCDKLVKLLLEVCDTSATPVEFFAYDDVEASQNSKDVDWDFYVSYGQHNEVKHVVDKIIEFTKEKDNAFDQINLFYTSPEYENYIAGLLDYAKIPYEFKDGYHAINTGFIQAFISLLDFVDSGYKYTDLEKFILNDAVTFSNVLSDNMYINPNKAYGRTPGDKIGWGRERYERYLESEEVKEMMEAAFSYAEAEKAQKVSDKDGGNEEPNLTEYEVTAEDEDTDAAESVNEEAEEAVEQKEQEYVELTKEERDRYAMLNQGFFALLLSDLLDVFDDKYTLKETFRKLIDFVGKYTYKKNAERRDLIADLRDHANVYEYVSPARVKTAADKIEYIRNYLENLTYSKRTGTVAVSVNRFSRFKALERPINFIIGMGAKQFAVNTTESAIMSDEEMERYLVNVNLPLAGERNVEHQEQLRMLIRTLEKGKFIVGYSKFDTVDLRECSPSVIFMELQGKRELGNTISYSPYDKEACVDAGKYRKYIEGITKDEHRRDRKPTIPVDKEASMSASELQVLLDCPIKYYYKSFRKLNVPITRQIKGDEWLSPIDRGNLFHRVAEEYMKKVMPPAADLTDTINEPEFEAIYAEKVKEMESEVPWSSDVIKAQETEEYKAVTYEFLSDLHTQWRADADNNKNWWVLGCELDFEYEDNLIYEDNGEALELQIKEMAEELGIEVDAARKKAKDKVDHPYRIHFRRGQIDRLDGYVDEDGCLNLRIIDYKTGKRDNKWEEILNNVQIQHHVYAMAAFSYVRKLKDRIVVTDNNIFDAYDIKDVKIVEAAYEFPLEENDKKFLSAMDRMNDTLIQDENDNFKWKVEFPEGVRMKLRLIEGRRQNGEIEAMNRNMLSLIPKSCAFCDYIKICRTRCGVLKPEKSNENADV